ncbi:hypothetical protein DICPUDRAFT_151905 [Dictyostelium purpureum]|uniref:F-box domain-containing protein n=1 Tax=Dictyostelium purpureum TaxID=5786 RepID=F0ZK20_DICPU|nr:uncharacterized protein DICPUDRAFT_151905 [Dictyostelium purpureum]EGC35712.1 hypothetical protein DICPUDRAFT_151905 [Dictyostelium purpureum]|eukprot:XP_003287768.1 hypothetical protein DICPUDRAFT_151905 [Dictyostelium purpureum]
MVHKNKQIENIENQKYNDIVKVAKSFDVFNSGKKSRESLIERIKQKQKQLDETTTTTTTTTTLITNNEPMETDSTTKTPKNDIEINNNEFSTNSIIIYQIIKYLDVDDYHSCELVNKQWKNVSNDNKLWEILFLKNILQINDFNNEKSIYSKGCLKQSFDNINNNLKFKDLYKQFFPHHYNRLSNFNKLKNIGIISNNGIYSDLDQIQSNLSNILEKENKNKKNKDKIDIKDLLKQISIDIFSIKSSLLLNKINSDSYSKIKKAYKPMSAHTFLLSEYCNTKSKNDELACHYSRTFQILICIPNQVKSVLDENQMVTEYSRFIKATFRISHLYDCEENFQNNGGEHAGLLKRESFHHFQTFDIDEPSFSTSKNQAEFKLYNPEPKKNDTNVSAFDYWYCKYDRDDHQRMGYDKIIKSSYINGLHEFTRNTFLFDGETHFKLWHFSNYESKERFFSNYYNYKEIFSSIETIKEQYKKKITHIKSRYNTNQNNDSVDIILLLDNITWKTNLYFNYLHGPSPTALKKEKDHFELFEKDNLKNFIEKSFIRKYSCSITDSFYHPAKESTYSFQFIIPYKDQENETKNLLISIYQCCIEGHETDKNYFDFSVKFKILDNQLNTLVKDEKYSQLFRLNINGDNKFENKYEKELISEKELENIKFTEFLSLLFKKKFPSIKFNLSNLLLMANMDKFVDYVGEKGEISPSVSDLNGWIDPFIEKVLNGYIF